MGTPEENNEKANFNKDMAMQFRAAMKPISSVIMYERLEKESLYYKILGNKKLWCISRYNFTLRK